MSFANQVPVPAFPGFKHFGVVAPQVTEIAVTFNAESLDALSTVPEKSVAWADVGTRVSPGIFQVKVPVRLPSSMAFETFDGVRSYGKLDIAAPTVKAGPFQRNFEWPMAIGQSGIAQLEEFYGASGLAALYVAAGKAHKAQLVASAIQLGMANSSLSMSASVFTIPQPGFPNGIALFSDGSDDTDASHARHFAHPFRKDSGRFKNVFYNAGAFTGTDVLGTVLTNMTQVPHPLLPNMNLGAEVTDIIGPTHMLIPFYKAAQQNLSLAISGGVGAATTNIYNPDLIEQAMKAGRFIGASGLTPWRFWIAPQLDNHPYLVANPGKHMWVAVSAPTGKPNHWCEMIAPNRDFTPIVTLFGDADPKSREERRVRMIGDLDAGAAAGLPHWVALYTETTP